MRGVTVSSICRARPAEFPAQEFVSRRAANESARRLQRAPAGGNIAARWARGERRRVRQHKRRKGRNEAAKLASRVRERVLLCFETDCVGSWPLLSL